MNPLDFIMDWLEMLYDKKNIEKKSQSLDGFFESVKLYSAYLLFVILFLSFLIFVFLLFVSPLLIQSADRTMLGVGALMYNLVSVFMMCHQLPMRSIFIFGVQQAVCARDIGFYSGIVVAGLLFLYRTPEFFRAKKFFLLTLIPIALDGITQTLLNLRESNNLLRILTGFIFGFGFMFLIATRVKRLNRPEFREMTRKRAFILLIAILLLLAFSLLTYLGLNFGNSYVSKTDAITIVLNSTSKNSRVFYIPPRAPLSFHFLPNSAEYDDYILSDINSMGWLQKQAGILFSNTMSFNETLSLDISSLLNHYYGIWVVVESTGDGSCQNTETQVFCNMGGTYYYIDALTQEVIDVRRH
ncbi:MAG: DUF2085 domain-containing protein [Candidatus Altiarchaeota archaeon]